MAEKPEPTDEELEERWWARFKQETEGLKLSDEQLDAAFDRYAQKKEAARAAEESDGKAKDAKGAGPQDGAKDGDDGPSDAERERAAGRRGRRRGLLRYLYGDRDESA